MKILIRDRLPYITSTLFINNQNLVLSNTILDTGSASCVFKLKKITDCGFLIDRDIPIRTLHGIGGKEEVFTTRIQKLSVGDLIIDDFEIELGNMNYGFDLDGIIGLDFLMKVGAVIDFKNLELRKVL